MYSIFAALGVVKGVNWRIWEDYEYAGNKDTAHKISSEPDGALISEDTMRSIADQKLLKC
ncbi:hypothetical protein XK86_19230 [Hafnia alvei]|nr:hypothetical protein XK86_19230 [Hafnia alvei]